MKVLVIDDVEAERYLVRRYLSQSGLKYEVHEAADGQSGLRMAETLNPDCILLDLKLPDKSGFEVLQELVGHERPPKRTVIIYTVLSPDPLREKAFHLGASDFLVKGRTDATALNQAILQAMKKPPSNTS